MSWQMVDGSSRRSRMSWAVLDHLKLNGNNGARRSLMPKIVNPEALLHHIESAIAKSEYGQASRYLNHLFPSTPTMPAPPGSRDWGGSVSQASLPSASSTAARENMDSRNYKQAENPSDHYVKLTNKSKPQSRFSLTDHELAANSQQLRSKQIGGHSNWNAREPASSDGNVFKEVARNYVALSDESMETESIGGKLFKDRTETVASKLPCEEDPPKASSEGLSTPVQGDTVEFANGSAGSNDTENTGQSFAVLQPRSEERNALADNDGEYDALAADEAYRAGRSALSEGKVELAMSLLQLASSKCPPNKVTALAKVQKLMAATVEMSKKQEANFNRPVMEKDGRL